MQVEKVIGLSEPSPETKDPGPVADLFASLMATAFYIGTRTSYKVQIIGLKNYTRSPSTLVVSNHKRDLDMLIIGPALHFGDRFPRPLVRPCFAAQADEFAPGFLATYYTLPQWLNQIILYRLDISPVMHAFRAHPMRQVHAATTNQALSEVLQMEGNVGLGTVLQESWLQKCADSLGIPINRLKSMTIRDFMNWRYMKVLRQKADSSMLQAWLCRRMRLFQGRAIRRELKLFAELLNRGKTLFLAPEGDFSSDGRLCPIRGSLYRLINMCSRTVKILPMNITYDFMTTGRMKAFLNIGQEIPETKGLTKAELEHIVKASLVKLTEVTLSQLGSHSIYQETINGNGTLTEERWRGQLATSAQEAEKVGFRVDRALLNERSFNANFKDFLDYCLQKGQITTSSPGRLQINRERIPDTSSGYSQNPIYYCHNEFSTLLGSERLPSLTT